MVELRGRWREVKILRPRFTRLTKPAKALAIDLPLTVVMLALLIWVVPVGVNRGGLPLVLALVLAAVTVRLVLATFRIISDILRPRYVRGLVIRAEPSGAPGRPRRWRRLEDTSWIVIDRGRVPWIRGIRYDPATAPVPRPGDHVRARVAPWTGWAHEIVAVAPAPHAVRRRPSR